MSGYRASLRKNYTIESTDETRKRDVIPLGERQLSRDEEEDDDDTLRGRNQAFGIENLSRATCYRFTHLFILINQLKSYRASP